MLLFRGIGIAEDGFWLRGVNTRHPSFQQYPFDMTYLGSVWSCSMYTRLSALGRVLGVSASRGGMVKEGVSLWDGSGNTVE